MRMYECVCVFVCVCVHMYIMCVCVCADGGKCTAHVLRLILLMCSLIADGGVCGPRAPVYGVYMPESCLCASQVCLGCRGLV